MTGGNVLLELLSCRTLTLTVTGVFSVFRPDSEVSVSCLPGPSILLQR